MEGTGLRDRLSGPDSSTCPWGAGGRGVAVPFPSSQGPGQSGSLSLAAQRVVLRAKPRLAAFEVRRVRRGLGPGVLSVSLSGS